MTFIKRRKRQKMGVRQPSQIRCQGHLKLVRGFRCAIEGKNGHECSNHIEAAHVRTETDGGTGLKPSDIYAIPLCSDAHKEQHQIGEPAFEKKYGLNLQEIATDLWKRSPHRIKYENAQHTIGQVHSQQ